MDVLEKSLEELEREITCAICQDHYTEPKVLPCLHYYCKQCVLTLSLSEEPHRPFSCPECRKEAILPDGSVDQLPTAFFVNRLKTMYSTLERAHGKVEVKCEACTDSGAKADAYCPQCVRYICVRCVESHRRLKVFDGHIVDPLEEFDVKRAKQHMVTERPLCSDHNAQLVGYCFNCNHLICRDCTVKDHRNCNFEFNAVAAPKIKEELVEQLGPLREVQVGLSHAVREMQTIKCELEAQQDSVANSIVSSFEELHKVLLECQQELLVEIRGKVKEKTAKLSSQEDRLSMAQAGIQRVLNYTEQCVSCCADNEVMCMHAEVRSRIEQEIEEHSKPGEPVEEVDIGVEVVCPEALQQLCLANAKIIEHFVSPSICTVSGEGTKTAELNKLSEASLITRLSNNKPTRCDHEIDCHLKSQYDRSIIKCKVDRVGAGEYHIQYVPIVRGRNELTVSVDGQQVAGSPFSVFVSIPPTKLGKPVMVFGGIHKPTGIASNSMGEVIITGEKEVVSFNKEGKRLKNIKCSEYELKQFSGIAVDGEDNIYFVDRDSSTIFKLNSNGRIVTKKILKQENGPGHLGLALVGDEVMVCEQANEGSIMVYDKELNHMRRIVGRNMGSFIDLSPDDHGNLYVTDSDNSCIQVFGIDGEFKRSLGCAVKKLKPRFVCVAGQYVYVTDYSNNDVSVFTIVGEYVTSFGHWGCTEGDFISPRGVCIDKDGFLYVCDSSNDRIQVF